MENEKDNADTITVNIVIQLAATNQLVTIVGEDIDLLVLHTSLTTKEKRNLI